MHIRALFAAVLIASGVPATADFPTIVEAHEVQLPDLRLPGSAGGTLAFRPCVQCDYQTVRVTSATRYEVNDESYTLEAFRKELARINSAADTSVTVMHHLESDTITAVRVSY